MGQDVLGVGEIGCVDAEEKGMVRRGGNGTSNTILEAGPIWTC